MVYCPNCGKENQDDATFCQECGKNLKEQPKAEEKRSNRKKYLLIGIIGLIAISAISYGFNQNKTYNDGAISFQYPKDWNQYTPDTFNIDRVAAFNTTKGDNSLLSIYIKDAHGEGLEYWKNIQKMALTSSETLISEGPVQIAGVTGYRIDYTYTDYGGGTQEDIIFVKNDKYYDLLFTTQSLSSINSDINTIVNSFQTT